ncbi:hypothetical protein [Desulfitobacterium chlororespirans]|uniref:Uncharacterized protein n=1 Tax=Desulfitobacterium chlororespirans DSM 11544 TaxID=1121395 RepID=A0A1M7UHJ5_9FIRM|nr:hypothetical protein [Desulfitobacterium chlororespirans]SHN82380.1 hypothetical protein SAMN02745215_03807 [Desulfitobacterium chlororespirans DSM 11544]
MIKFRRISSLMCLILLLFILSGCADRPFLTKEGTYSIVSISPEDTIQKTPIELTWNSNIAVMQKLLLEASFVLSDLHSIPEAEPGEALAQEEATLVQAEESTAALTDAIEPAQDLNELKIDSKAEIPGNLPGEPAGVVLLEATFPEVKSFELLIDNELKTLHISSIQIEVIGNHPSRVLLNQSIVLQGIPNPNLQSAFEEYLKMQQKTEQIPGNA